MKIESFKYINVKTGHREIIGSFKNLIRELPTGYKYYVVSQFYLDIETNEVTHEHEVCINWGKVYRVIFAGTAKECIDYINKIAA